jgi:hypothetical protein
MDEPVEERRFSNERMREIMLRAAELEREADVSVSETRLREIAAEVGIDGETLARAIAQLDNAERRTAAVAVPSRSRSRIMSPLGLLVSGGAGLLLGGASGAFRNLTLHWSAHVDTLLTTLLAALIASLIAGAARTTKSQLGFQLRSAALWIGYSAGFAAGFPMLAEDMIGMGTLFALLSAAIGGVVVATGSSGGRLGGWFARVRTRKAAKPDANAPANQTRRHRFFNAGALHAAP